jgi:hypothetical protein
MIANDETAARHAGRGFDGVEMHSANGYTLGLRLAAKPHGDAEPGIIMLKEY